MVGQDHGPVLAESGCDALASVAGQDLYLLVVEQGVIPVEQRRFLAYWLDHAAFRCERGAPMGVHVGRGHHVGPGLVDGVVDVVGGVVDAGGAPVRVGGTAVGSDEHEVGGPGPLEGDAMAEQPHVVLSLGVAAGDVPVAQLGPAQRPEEPVGGSQIVQEPGPLSDRILQHPLHRRPPAFN